MGPDVPPLSPYLAPTHHTARHACTVGRYVRVNFSVALDLKPASGDVNLIKSAIEKLHVPDDSEDDDL